MSFLSKIFGGGNQRDVNRVQPIVDRVNELEPGYEKLSDEKLRGKTNEFKKRVAEGATLDDIMGEAFAAVREAAKREIGQRHFDVQIVGGAILHQGKIAEMKTGEGKTLVATLSLYLNALSGKGAHLITVNDYLAKFQGEWMGRIYDRLGLTTGIAQNQGISFVFERGWGEKNLSEEEVESAQKAAGVNALNLRPSSRRDAYAADITYGTNNEFGFDYLRDNMAQLKDQLVQRGLNYAIVDEVDSILIDEARTPLIISAPAEESADLYAKFAGIIPRLQKDTDYEVDEKAKAVSILDEGIRKIEGALGIVNIYDASSIALVHHLEEALKAEVLFKKDRDYIVKDGEVLIVDEFTGRLMHGRRFSEGLHQAIEAKEGVEIKKESDTLATISFQNLFRLYDKLAGMTGTAATEAEEFGKIYKLDVVEIPTNKPMVRIDHQDQIYKTEIGKYKAIVGKIRELHENGTPVLVGTISIQKSEIISKLLDREGIAHEVLNAKQHEREARIIAQAGQPGAVTVATNMAGRGVDILLGGNPPKSGDAEKVIEAGGLFVLGTERHESRRIDNQLRGRSGRQGDPGESQFFISMDDDLMRIFGGDRLRNIMERLGLPEDQPIQHSMVSKSIESAQRRVEGHNFDIRKHLVEYDDVMNKQREVLYKKRRKILELNPEADQFLHEDILALLNEEERKGYEEKTKGINQVALRDLEKRVYLSVIDQLWVEHLNTMDQLRDSIGLRGYGQVDPLVAYKEESFNVFQGLLNTIDDEAVGIILKIDFSAAPRESAMQPPPAPAPEKMELRGAQEETSEEVLEEAAAEEETAVAEAPENLPEEESKDLPAPVPEEAPTISESLDDRSSDQSVGEIVKQNKKAGVVTVVRNVAEKMSQAVEGGQTSSTVSQKVGRNDPCPCGAKKADGRPVKFKHCHGR